MRLAELAEDNHRLPSVIKSWIKKALVVKGHFDLRVM